MRDAEDGCFQIGIVGSADLQVGTCWPKVPTPQARGRRYTAPTGLGCDTEDGVVS